MENKLDRNDLIDIDNNLIDNKKKNKTFGFLKVQSIKIFGREIYNNNLSLDDALE